MKDEMQIQDQVSSLSEVEQYEAYRMALRKAYCGSLYHTCHTLLGYSDMTPHTHQRMITLLESKLSRKLLCVPRGSFKSSVGVIGYSIWLLMNNPNLRILIDSEVYTNSANFLREIKGHLQSDKFIDVFGDWRGEVWKEGEIVVAPRTVNKKEASITCSGVGAVKVGQHYDVIIGDDYNSNKNSGTDEGRRKIVQHYKYNLSILEQEGEYVLIGTRYAENDLIGWVVENEIGVKDFRDRTDFLRNGLTKKNGVYIYE